jgi:hypothetical protein
LPRILLCPLVPFLAIDILCPLGMAERWPCGHQKYIWLLVVWLEVCDPEKGVTEGGALNTLQNEESSPEWLQLSSSLSLFAKSQARGFVQTPEVHPVDLYRGGCLSVQIVSAFLRGDPRLGIWLLVNCLSPADALWS